MKFPGFSLTKPSNIVTTERLPLKCTEVNEMTAVLQGSVLTAYTQGYVEKFRYCGVFSSLLFNMAQK